MGAAALVAVAAVAAGCADAPTPPGAEPPTDLAVDRHEVAATRVARLGGLLTSMTMPTDDEVLVGARDGAVWRLVRRRADGFVRPVLDPEPVVDLRGEVSVAGEQGLFDLAAVDDGRAVLVSYTAIDGSLVVERFPFRPGEPIERADGTEVLRLPWSYPWHHGGSLAVLDDGDVLVGIGDQGLSPPGVPVSQDPGLLFGSIVRVPAAAVAAPDSGWAPSPLDVVARGLRNPWKMSIDARAGDLWIGEVGNDVEEEIDRIALGSLTGDVVNFGWPYVEGSVVIDDRWPDDARFAEPALTRAYGDGVCGMVGGFVYRGAALPWLRGHYLYSDLCDPTVLAAPVRRDGSLGPPARVVQLAGPVVTLSKGPGGEPFALGAEGELWRLDPASWTVADDEQAVPTAVPATTAPDAAGPDAAAPDGERVDCGVVGAIYPLLHLGSLRPDELRAAMVAARTTLADKTPALPPSLRPYGQDLLNTMVALDERLAEFGWDMTSTSPEAAALRTDMIEASGSFAEFSPALAAFMESGCR